MKIKKELIDILGEDYAEKVQIFIDENYIPKKVEELKWFDEWYNLWPDGVKSGGKPIKSDREKCYGKMIKFVKQNNYSPLEIINATRDYLYDREQEGFSYTMLATNFISHREKGSLLASLCEQNKKEKVTVNNYNDLV